MEFELIDRWDSNGEEYITYEMDDYSRVDVKRTEDGFIYVMECNNGYEVYGTGLEGYRNLTEDERNMVLQTAGEQFEVEAELNAKA